MKILSETMMCRILASLFFCGLGVVVSFALQLEFGIQSYLSSALVGFAGSFAPKMEKIYNQKEAVASIYTGSFAAMTSLSYLKSLYLLLLLIVSVTIFFLLMKTYFKGYGGKLGAIAFFASFTFVSIERLL